MKDLGTLTGGVTSMANSINSSGVIVGQSDGSGTRGHWHAVLWNSADKIQDLGVLPGGNYSVAFAVNDSSVVVGYGNLFEQCGARDGLDFCGGNEGSELSHSSWIADRVLINANAI